MYGMSCRRGNIEGRIISVFIHYPIYNSISYPLYPISSVYRMAVLEGYIVYVYIRMVLVPCMIVARFIHELLCPI